ncbi:SigE family RNA polymerase sigma factor [Phytohabitans aurantiacus]|uniref:RNA polymerase sigma24 factor n=1 Tax=Phytohabitans aurantiacus TaxID=3016789 RepID=A0ABQ5R8E9_9ACTN|nr:SigE family RNA polymerase sigma factor [Phytohabitans aurantiacus]GLI02861.1 RNA polymerase sigma24 factor [Phytohabitans aurantiacus]
MTFEEYVAARLPALLRQATALAGDPHVAEDVVQDVLIKAQPRWSRIREYDIPDAYLRKMIVNELLSARRRVAAALRRERVQYAAPQPDGADEVVVRREALLQVIRTLPARQRVVIALRYFEDMADADIAGVLGCTEGTVRSQASRALAKLREVAALQPVLEEE